MEFQLKQFSLKVEATDKAAAAKYIRDMAPRLGGTTMSDIEEIETEKNKVMAIWIPEKDSEPVLTAKLPILAWDSFNGIKLAIVASPDNKLFWVDMRSQILLGKSPTDIPNREDIWAKERKLHNRLSYSPKNLSSDEFWMNVNA